MTSDSSNTSTFSIYPDVSESDGSGWMEGITFQRNYIYNSYGEHAFFYRTKYLTVENNKTYNFAQGYDANAGLRFNCTEDLVVRNNEFAHDDDSSSDTSAVYVSFHGAQRALFEYNTIYGTRSGSCFSIKEGGFTPYSYDNDNVIVRFNHISDCGNVTATEGKGISVLNGERGDTNNIYVYGNRIYNTNDSNIRASTQARNVYIWSNILSDAANHGVLVGPRLSTETPPDGVYVYNNTIARGNTDDDTDASRGGIVVTDGTNINIKNNLLWNNRPSGGGSHYNQIYSAVSLATLEHNTLYRDSTTASWYYDSDYRSLSTMQSSYNFEDDSPAGVVSDPNFTDSNGSDNTYGTVDDDYTLDGSYVNNGKDLGGATDFSITVQGTTYYMGYAIGLDPYNTDWTTTPPTVNTLNQDNNGRGWERGAYVYSKDNSNRTLASPSNLKVKNVRVE
jgi:hypothetical protein